jgi:hypothetical protein
VNRLILFVACVLGLIVCAGPAFASDERGLTSYFNNVEIAPGQVVEGNVNVFFANVEVDGQVDGDVNVFGGSCDLGPDAQIGGRVNCASGTLAAIAPFAVANSDRAIAAGGGDGDLYLRLASGFVTVVLFLLFPLRTRLALDRVERHPGVAALVGVFGFLAVLPIALLLLFSIVGIPLIPVVAAAGLGGVWIGIGAIALVIGRRLSEVIVPRTTPSPFAALLLGLVVVTAAEMLPKIGGVVTAIVYIIGFGATIVSFVGSDRLNRFPGVSRTPGTAPSARGF